MASGEEKLPSLFFLSPSFLTMFLFFICFFSTIKSQEILSTDPSYYYNLCAPSTCNNLTFSYPLGLSRFCHHPNLFPSCIDNQFLHFKARGGSPSGHRVVGNITSDGAVYTVRLATNALFSCAQLSRHNYMVTSTNFLLSDNYTYGTHLNCTRRPRTDQVLMPVSCLGCEGSNDNNVCYYVPGYISFPECEDFFIHTLKEFNVSAENDLRGYLKKGFIATYTLSTECRNCVASGGRCGTTPDASSSFICFCASSAHSQTCSDGIIIDLKTWKALTENSGGRKTLVVALSTSLSVVILIALATLAIIFVCCRKSTRVKDQERRMNIKDGPQTDLKDLVQGITPKRYSYSDIKKFTTNFTTELGKGGFGSVYKGIIQVSGNDVPVAIKLLKISKQSEKQFMNEVATVGRIHHNNLARILGYCVQGKRRALVYEFMEKGSLDKYIYKIKKEGNELEEDGVSELLLPRQLYNIAFETAKGVLYLHEGCRSRILHCDIKPHNVLLDSNFSAKVSDFGLARMIDKDHSHVSLTSAQGTPGYMAPEIWSKSYGPVTEKSDVYSYGMLLLEMAGGRKNYDLAVPASSQVYFPEWVFKKVVNMELNSKRTMANPEEIIGDEMSDDNAEILNKMCLVGLWCIQHIPSNRPSMRRVIQMLEGNAEIQTPPNPFPEEGRETQTNILAQSTVYLSAKDESIGTSSFL